MRRRKSTHVLLSARCWLNGDSSDPCQRITWSSSSFVLPFFPTFAMWWGHREAKLVLRPVPGLADVTGGVGFEVLGDLRIVGEPLPPAAVLMRLTYGRHYHREHRVGNDLVGRTPEGSPTNVGLGRDVRQGRLRTPLVEGCTARVVGCRFA